MDFAWQRDPFALIVGDGGCEPNTPPSASQFAAHGGPAQPGDLDHRLREGPAVDFLLAYWLGVYLGIVPGPAAPFPSPTPPPPTSEPTRTPSTKAR